MIYSIPEIQADFDNLVGNEILAYGTFVSDGDTFNYLSKDYEWDIDVDNSLRIHLPNPAKLLRPQGFTTRTPAGYIFGCVISGVLSSAGKYGFGSLKKINNLLLARDYQIHKVK